VPWNHFDWQSHFEQYSNLFQNKSWNMQRTSKDTFVTNLLQLADALLVLFGFYLAFSLRDPLIDFISFLINPYGYGIVKQGMTDLHVISSTLAVVVPFAPLALRFVGFYKNPLTISAVRAFILVVGAISLVICWFSLLNLFLKFEQSSRALLLFASVFIAAMLLMRHFLWRLHFAVRVGKHEIKESVLLAGDIQSLQELEILLQNDKTRAWKISGRHDLLNPDWDQFQSQLHDDAVERVIIAGKNVKFSNITTAVEMCEMRGIEAWVSAQFMQTKLARPSFDSIHGSPMLVLSSTPDFCWELIAKEIMDRSLAFLFIFCTWPFWFIVAIGIKLQSPGPVFFRQVRAGKYGKPFRMWKFRSMFVGADAKLEEVKAQMGNLMTGPVFKLDNDPRIFPLGHILRKLSIDEFPQMINVLKGEMSLVGPRPMSFQELPNIERSEHRRKLSVKPGITCIWQVKGRNSITNFDDWVKLDLEYIDTWSLWLDIKLLFQTIPAVLLARGAK
jgi:exopolysaccharide biosynthesis polyprenyl glycosylphosphotransferase